MSDLRNPLVEIDNLVVRFAPHGPARVDGVSLVLHRGECLALVGESGSGKSVTARTIVGLTAFGGEVRADRIAFDAVDTRHWGERDWRSVRGKRIGFVLQDALSSLDPLRTVGAEVGEPLRLHEQLSRHAREEKVLDLLRSVGVPEPELRVRQRPRELSGGQRQRALIASAIACDPDLLIADEPTTALDAAVQAQVVALLAQLRDRDRAMLVVSHDLAVVARLADRIAVMRHGRIIEHGLAEQILEDPKHPYTQELQRAARVLHASAPRLALVTPTAPEPRPAPLIEVVNIAKSFRGPDGQKRPAVRHLSLTLEKGETLGIVGESGSGKTTLTRLILGLETPDHGVVCFAGRNWATMANADRRAARKRVQVVFQDPLASFDPRYTVGRVLGEARRVHGGRAAVTEDAIRSLLELVQLDPDVADRRPIELSGGQRQRVAIARALAPQPDILICDEPVSALDVYVQAQILELLNDLKERLSLSCIFISHDLGVIRRISDRVLVMHRGEVVESGTAQAVFHAPSHPYTRALVDAVLPVTPAREPLHA
jgi:peptide/nickel transport system ATP-binding protein